jgi:hypothetical protein
VTRKRKKPLPFDRFRDYVLDSARAVGAGFTKPNEDWMPVLMMDNGMKILVVALGDVMRTRQTKSLLPGMLLGLFTTKKPAQAALVLSGWHVQLRQDDPLAELSIDMMGQYGVSAHPDRKELLMVEIAAQDRAASETYHADISPWGTRCPMSPIQGGWGYWLGISARMA